MKAKKNNDSLWAGERLETNRTDLTTFEHLHRYALLLGHVGGKTVLDVASGEGYGSYLLAGCAGHVTGVDISAEAVGYACSKYRKDNLAFLEGDVCRLPVESGSVDLVVSYETLEHHDRHDEMMGEIKRVLKREGCLVISTPNKRVYTDAPATVNPYHVKELYFDEFQALVARHFRLSRFYNQKLVCGSLIGCEEIGRFAEFGGDFAKIRSCQTIEDPAFFLCVASDVFLPELGISYFDGFKQIFAGLKDAYESSLSYRLGHAILNPFRVMMNRLGLR